MHPLFDFRYIAGGMQLGVLVGNIYRLTSSLGVPARTVVLIKFAQIGAAAVLMLLAVFVSRFSPVSNWLFILGSFLFFLSPPSTIKDKRTLPQGVRMAKLAGGYALVVTIISFVLIFMLEVQRTHSLSTAVPLMLNLGWLLIVAAVVNMAVWFLMHGYFNWILRSFR